MYIYIHIYIHTCVYIPIFMYIHVTAIELARRGKYQATVDILTAHQVYKKLSEFQTSQMALLTLLTGLHSICIVLVQKVE